MEVRLHARHNGGELSREYMKLRRDDNPSLSEHSIRQAFDDGLADRASGVRCMCRVCVINTQRIDDHQRLRTDYWLRRREELQAAGLDDYEIQHRIDIEIANGAALRGTTHQEAGR